MPDFIKHAEAQAEEINKKNNEERKDKAALAAQIDHLRKDLEAYLKHARKNRTVLDTLSDGTGVRLEHGTRELFITMTRKDRYVLKHVSGGEVDYGKSSDSNAVDERGMMDAVIEWLKAAK